jgi:hypothetical protein
MIKMEILNNSLVVAVWHVLLVLFALGYVVKETMDGIKEIAHAKEVKGAAQIYDNIIRALLVFACCAFLYIMPLETIVSPFQKLGTIVLWLINQAITLLGSILS